MGTGGEGAKFWMSVLTDLRNRGVRNVFVLVCDGLKGLPDVVENVWPQAVVQTCIILSVPETRRSPADLVILGRRCGGMTEQSSPPWWGGCSEHCVATAWSPRTRLQRSGHVAHELLKLPRR
jgi:hypothetical protein